jgi:hypothetical protein
MFVTTAAPHRLVKLSPPARRSSWCWPSSGSRALGSRLTAAAGVRSFRRSRRSDPGLLHTCDVEELCASRERSAPAPLRQRRGAVAGSPRLVAPCVHCRVPRFVVRCARRRAPWPRPKSGGRPRRHPLRWARTTGRQAPAPAPAPRIDASREPPPAAPAPRHTASRARRMPPADHAPRTVGHVPDGPPGRREQASPTRSDRCPSPSSRSPCSSSPRGCTRSRSRAG